MLISVRFSYLTPFGVAHRNSSKLLCERSNSKACVRRILCVPVLVGKSVSADILKSISDFDINRSPEFVIGYYCVKIFGNIGRFSFEFGIVPCGLLVSATEKTTAVVASQPVTKAATSDEQTQEPTWNYSELKRKSSDISENFDAIITDNKFRGTVYVKIGNALEYIGTNGFSDKDRHTKNSTDTCFRIASLTKQFTACCRCVIHLTMGVVR